MQERKKILASGGSAVGLSMFASFVGLCCIGPWTVALLVFQARCRWPDGSLSALHLERRRRRARLGILAYLPFENGSVLQRAARTSHPERRCMSRCGFPRCC